MQELQIEEIELVSGAIDQATQVGAQMGFIGIGAGLAAAGFALTPVGAALFIGTSLALTGSYVYNYYYG